MNSGTTNNQQIGYLSAIIFGVLAISNILCCCKIYQRKPRNLRPSSAASLVFNLAFIDVLLTLKDSLEFLLLSKTGEWKLNYTACYANNFMNSLFYFTSLASLLFLLLHFEELIEHDDYVRDRNCKFGIVFIENIVIWGIPFTIGIFWSKYFFLYDNMFCRTELTYSVFFDKDSPKGRADLNNFTIALAIISIGVLAFFIYRIISSLRSDKEKNSTIVRLQMFVLVVLVIFVSSFILKSVVFTVFAQRSSLLSAVLIQLPVFVMSMFPCAYLIIEASLHDMAKTAADGGMIVKSIQEDNPKVAIQENGEANA